MAISKVLLIVLIVCNLVFYSRVSSVPIDVKDNSECRFAPNFSIQELLYNKQVQAKYLASVMTFEGKFHSGGVGYNENTGITYDGHPIDYTSGGMYGTPHNFTAASKESLHINVLTLALEGNENARIFVDPGNPSNYSERCITILTKKISSYEAFNKKFPGFAGFLPWVTVSDKGMAPTWDFVDKVPGLDNGQLAWAIYGLVHALTRAGTRAAMATTCDICIGYADLAARYNAQLQMMKSNALMVFYDGGGKIRALTKILNTTATPTPENYVNGGGDYYLDDPYEGELMAFFMDLFGAWKDPQERELVWEYKRAKLQSVDYQSKQGNITVQRGWWFSAHEQWKLLVLPYYSVPIARRVFTNCERARTVHSAENYIPGLYASVNDVSTTENPPDYLSAAGIQQIAFNPITRKDVITPYGTMPVLLANYSVGLCWYNNMLKAPKMQGPFGSTESINVNGTLICPLLTWDSKITTVVSMLGGIAPLCEKYMKKEMQTIVNQPMYKRFVEVVNREYSLKFPTLRGEEIDFGLPTSNVPNNRLKDFTEC